MANIGSVFLGDSKRIRVLSSPSTSTPPSSPPPTASTSVSMAGVLSDASAHSDGDVDEIYDGESQSLARSGETQQQWPHSQQQTQQEPPPAIDPEVSLELRLRWLEAIVWGVKGKNTPAEKQLAKAKLLELGQGDTIARAAANLQRRLDGIVDRNDGLKRFMGHYDQHAHFLSPAFALGLVPDAPSYENMSSAEFEVYLREMSEEIRAADKDMQEIEALDKKGVTGAGKLADHIELEPRLNKLIQLHEENDERTAVLQKRIAGIIEEHATYVDALSELFVAWDDTITGAELKISRLERDREERQRLGLE
ncbi:hypothetical protein K435DRAFT_775463 [Dendrothele bispora CBS 962.96]|uniref:Uncharacterized protein n=1 Tax=Dendrothele bispora (strain CBS 962.96) TaxID=1314807 RepID=A0A4S8MIB7_DENBC|nr:hypothetical protein K435DRAFT_775463 [Dendrothele bispora CBS 962.96]